MEELIWSISRLVKVAPPAVTAGGDGGRGANIGKISVYNRKN
jgi:hypothetical protein